MKILNGIRLVLFSTLITSLFVYTTLVVRARTPVVEDNEVELSVARMAKVGFAGGPEGQLV